MTAGQIIDTAGRVIEGSTATTLARLFETIADPPADASASLLQGVEAPGQ